MGAKRDSKKNFYTPYCWVMPLRGIGERRRYRNLAQPFAAHTHDHYVIGLVEEGARTLTCNGRQVDLGPGDLVVFNPGDVHACEQCSGGVFAYDSITVDASLLDGAMLQGPKVTNEEAKEAFRNLISLISAKDEAAVAEGVLRLCELLLADEPEAAAPEAVLRLCELLLADEPEERPSRANNDAAEHVMAHFCGHLSEPDALEALARREGISPYALIRAYRARFSITPMKHLASLRVECARRLLAQGISPAAVAAEVGFADQPHLTRAFKQRLGTTPAAYQRMAMEGK